MRLRAALLLLAGLGACSSPNRTPAAAYRNFWDRLQVATGLAGIVGFPCMEPEHGRFGDYLSFVGEDACYRFRPPARMRGVWVREFEGSAFYPDGAKALQGRTWLQAPEEFERRLPVDSRQMFRVDFIGRRTLYPGAYGHMGGSRDLVLVDRFLSIRQVGGSVRPLSRREGTAGAAPPMRARP